MGAGQHRTARLSGKVRRNLGIDQARGEDRTLPPLPDCSLKR
jgi:hypothetical protein